ncbi:MAG: PQQ-binding-like beta-propeller repeat protein [Thermoguttaceae bacterium]|nr:PQQ-binding-like beta-propeller repeat protein [Thermoguttaceae bacterium]MDW8038606.1 PQQ-binding-like beta-propeller repeat protein [Thermoguttaceae bacterium]
MDRWLNALLSIGKQAQGHQQAQQAWIQLVRHARPSDLPTILARIDPDQPLASNWLVLAAQAVWQRAGQHSVPGQKLSIWWETLLRVYQNRQYAPRARFLVYQWLVEMRPEEKPMLLAQALDDPSLDIRREAIELLVQQGQHLQQAGRNEQAIAEYRRALSAARDPDQIDAIAKALRQLGQSVDIARHFGFLRSWKLIGPFDNTQGRGFARVYPPETEWNPQGQYTGKHGLLRWIDHQTNDDYGIVDLNKILGEEKDVVGYAAAEFFLSSEREVQIRIGSPNAIKLWLNGRLVASHEVYHSGSQIDQYIVPVRLRAGKNFLLVKVCQNNIPQDWARFWQFQLRICDGLGTAILPDQQPSKEQNPTSTENEKKFSSSEPCLSSSAAQTSPPEQNGREDTLAYRQPGESTVRQNLPLGQETVSAFAKEIPQTAQSQDGEGAVGPWPQFRGPGSNPVFAGKPAPVDFGPDKYLAWRTALPGRGASSPIVLGHRVIVTASSGPRQDRLHVLCLDAQSGKLLWDRLFWATGSTVCNPFTAVAAPTPASDGRYIVAMYSSNDLVCFDLEGNVRWLRGLGYEHPLTRNDVGMASSPLILGQMVVVQCETFGDSFAAAVHLADGTTLWQVPRPATSMWASPVLYAPPSGPQRWILMHSRSALTALDPDTGREAWRYEAGCHSMASSVVVGDRILLPGGGMQCLRWDNQRQQPELLWRQTRLVCGAPSPAVLEGNGKNGKIYTIRDPGILLCARLSDGQILWQLRLQGPIWATPVISGNHLYAVSHAGLVQVVELPPSHAQDQKNARIIHTCQLDEGILATPALADGAIYFRSDRWLWKFAAPTQNPAAH